MPKFKQEVPHNLTADEARERLQHFAESLESKLGDQVKNLHQTWEGNTLDFGFRTFGINVEGKMFVADDKVTIEGNLPFSAMMFKGKIESEIRQQLERILR